MLIGKRYILLLLGTLLSLSGKAQTVYKTPSGAKYHLASCRMVKNVSEEMTIEKARALGLEPCKICNPQQAYAVTSVVLSLLCLCLWWNVVSMCFYRPI